MFASYVGKSVPYKGADMFRLIRKLLKESSVVHGRARVIWLYKSYAGKNCLAAIYLKRFKRGPSSDAQSKSLLHRASPGALSTAKSLQHQPVDPSR